jgi:hypothetical protein
VSAETAPHEPQRVQRRAPALEHQAAHDSDTHQLLRLQRLAGNQAVQRLLVQRDSGQPRLSTSTAYTTVQRCGGSVHEGCDCAAS